MNLCKSAPINGANGRDPLVQERDGGMQVFLKKELAIEAAPLTAWLPQLIIGLDGGGGCDLVFARLPIVCPRYEWCKSEHCT